MLFNMNDIYRNVYIYKKFIIQKEITIFHWPGRCYICDCIEVFHNNNNNNNNNSNNKKSFYE